MFTPHTHIYYLKLYYFKWLQPKEKKKKKKKKERKERKKERKRIKEWCAHIVSVHHDDYAWWYVLFSNKIIRALSGSFNKNIFPNSCLKNRGCWFHSFHIFVYLSLLRKINLSLSNRLNESFCTNIYTHIYIYIIKQFLPL